MYANRFITVALAMSACANAAPLTWDGNGNTAPNPAGGAGVWDVNTSLNWWDGVNNVTWPALGGTDDDAIFGTAGGTVSLAAGGVTANDLFFNTTGYTLQSNTLTLNGTTPTIFTDTGVSALISSIVSGSAGLTKTGTGSLVLTGANNYTGGTTISGGTLQIGNATANGTIGSGTYSIAAGSKLYLNYATASAPTWGNFSGAGTLELNSAQAVNGTANWNSVTALSLTPSFTGTVQVDRGRIHGTPAGLGGTTNVVIADGAQFLAFDGTTNSFTFPQNFSIAGLGWGESGFNLGALRVSTMNATFTGNITLTGNSALYTQNAAGSAMTVTGPISDGGSGFGLTINATATATAITLSNPANSWGGATTVATGTLKLGAAGVIPDGAGKGNVTVAGTLDLNGFSETVNGLSGAGIVDTKVAGTPVFTVGNNDQTSTFTGSLRNTAGTLALTKIGTGTQTLSGTSTYTGATTVSAGSLLLSGGVLSTSSPVSVATGTTFGGRGTAGAVTVSPGATIQGGLADTGSLSLTALTFTGNSSLNLSPVTGTTASVAASGAVTTSGTQTINITNTNPLPAGAYRLVSYGSVAGGGTGAFTLGTTPATGAFRPRTYALDTSPATYVGLNVTGDAPVWTGGTDGSWDTTTTGNWKLASDNTTPTTYYTGDLVQFNDTTGTRNLTINGSNVTPSSVVFNNSTGNDYTFTGTAGIGGTTSLVKNGAGKVTLATTNSYTGGTTVSGGTLELGNGTTNGVITGNITNTANVTFNNGAAQTYTGVISGAGGTLTKTGPGILTLSGSSSFTGATTITGGTLSTATLARSGVNSTIGAGSSIVLDGGTFRYTGGNFASDTLTAQYNRGITLGAGGGTFDIAGSGFVFYNGNFSGSGTLRVIDSSGDINNRQLLLTSNNPGFSGPVVIGSGAANSGWLQVRSNAVNPVGTGTITLNTGGILSSDGGTTAPTTLGNNIIMNGGTILTQNADNNYTGSVTANPATTSFFQTGDSKALIVSGGLLGTGTIQKTGNANAVELRGNNSAFAGAYNHTADGATVFTTASSASALASWNIPSGSNVNARFAASAANATYQLGALSGTTGRLENFSAAAGNSVFEIGALNTSTTFGGTITNGAGGTVGITKTGTGVLTLTGTNTYTGPTFVSAGELKVNGSIATSGITTVASGAILSGSGSLGAISFAAGSTVSPGNSPGILNTGSASSSGNLVIEIGGATPGNGAGFYDQINTTGTLTLDGGALTISLINGYVPAAYSTYDIWQNDGGDAIAGAGTFTGLPEASQISVPETTGGPGGGLDSDYWLISYIGNTGNDIRLTYVPEPSTALVGSLTALALLARRRRRSA